MEPKTVINLIQSILDIQIRPTARDVDHTKETLAPLMNSPIKSMTVNLEDYARLRKQRDDRLEFVNPQDTMKSGVHALFTGKPITPTIEIRINKGLNLGWIVVTYENTGSHVFGECLRDGKACNHSDCWAVRQVLNG